MAAATPAIVHTTFCLAVSALLLTQQLLLLFAAFTGVPPGYFLDVANSKLVKCPTNINGQGYYRNGWVRWNETSVQDTDGTKACTPCGAGILSNLMEADTSTSDNTSLVASSADACCECCLLVLLVVTNTPSTA
jgi:hypothetical protein